LNALRNRESEITPIHIHTLGKEKAAINLLDIISKITDSRNRTHNLRWCSTLLQKFGIGLNLIATGVNPLAKIELAIVWRKEWVGRINKKGTISPQVKSHMRSIIITRTKGVIRTGIEQIRIRKEMQKNGQTVSEKGIG